MCLCVFEGSDFRRACVFTSAYQHCTSFHFFRMMLMRDRCRGGMKEEGVGTKQKQRGGEKESDRY